MPDFAAHIGAGQRQPRDLIVADLTRTRNWRVYCDDGSAGGTQVEYRSGRIDAIATPQTVRPHPDQLLDIRRDLGFSRAQMLAALNDIFGTRARRLTINGN